MPPKLLLAQLVFDLDDSVVNLKKLDEMCGHYVAGRFGVITSKQYDRLDYEEG